MKIENAPGTWRFVKSLLAGAMATVIDLSTLALLVEAFHLRPTQANVPALLAGAIAQFVSSRGFVFEAREGSLGAQLAGFTIVELGTLALNAITFHLAVTHTPVPYPIARALCQFAVYVGFSYPLWTRVFAAKPGSASPLRREPGTEAG